MTEERIEKAHNDFINSILDIAGTDYYATAASDYKVNLWSKQTFQMLHSFDLPGEVVSMTKAANDQLICGMINGAMGVIDVARMKIGQIQERAHTGTVISCVALCSTGKLYVVSQDDSRELKVWNIKDMTTPIIKTIGRSYNPVWYV